MKRIYRTKKGINKMDKTTKNPMDRKKCFKKYNKKLKLHHDNFGQCLHQKYLIKQENNDQKKIL